MIEQLNLEDWAWQLSTEAYRLNLYSHLTRQAEPNRSSVTEAELAEAIRDSFTQVNEAAYREMVRLATDAALETYDRLVSSTVKTVARPAMQLNSPLCVLGESRAQLDGARYHWSVSRLVYGSDCWISLDRVRGGIVFSC